MVRFFNQKKESGFTLIEILVVITVLGILAAIVIVLVNPAQSMVRARDSQRKKDIRTINDAIVAYGTTFGDFPTPSQGSLTLRTDDITGDPVYVGQDRTSWGIGDFIQLLHDNNYLKAPLQDPNEPEAFPDQYIYYYHYKLSDTQIQYANWRDDNFLIMAGLENIEDPDCLKWREADDSLTTLTFADGTRCYYMFESGILVTVQND